LIVLLAGIYVFGGGMRMTGLEVARMAQPLVNPCRWAHSLFGRKYVVLFFFMWWIMMIAMMVPSAAPDAASIHSTQTDGT
jgi:predicted metal-binding membrane protein